MLNWLKTLVSGKPHFIVGGENDPYLYRWYLLPRNRFFNLYLHKFLRDDDDRALHDHPWWFVSWIIKGSYHEVVDATQHPLRSSFATPYDNDPYDVEIRERFSLAYRAAEHRHRVILLRDERGEKMPVWTLIATGAKGRTWGFWCPKGFVPWYDFVDQSDHGNIGRGCE